MFLDLPKNSTIITPTKRLTLSLQNQYPQQKIIFLNDWLKQLWFIYLKQNPDQTWQLLSDWQSTLIWQNLLEKSNLNLLRPKVLQDNVKLTWQYLQQWEIPLNQFKDYVEYPENDYALFYHWATQYQQYCLQENGIDEFCLADFLQKNLKASEEIQKTWVFYQFDHMVPQLKTLAKCLKDCGAEIIEKKNVKNNQVKSIYYTFNDANEEIYAAALWAKQLWEQGKEKIAIVVPDLHTHFTTIKRIMTEILQPKKLQNAVGDALFNLAGGLSLSQYPLIEETFLLLKSIIFSLEYADMSRLLRSPYWPCQQNYFQQCQLTVNLASDNFRKINWNDLNPYFKEKNQDFSEVILNLTEERKDFLNSHDIQNWAEKIKQFLKKIKWTEGRTLNSDEYQTFLRFDKLLDELADLNLIIKKPIKFLEILQLLQQKAHHIIFQPETENAPIQVINMEDTHYAEYEHLWITGLTADNWPPAKVSYPFIPLAIQKSYVLPYSSLRHIYQDAAKLTQNWFKTAKELIFSYPLQDNNASNLPSPLIMTSVSDIIPESSYSYYSNKTHDLIKNLDDCGKTLTECPQKLKGGSALLQAQAECPFSAYANYRLGLKFQALKPPDRLGEGKDRGTIVHKILENIWSKLQIQDALLKLSELDLKKLVFDETEQAVNQFYLQDNKNLKAPLIFIDVEKEKIAALVFEWLNKEKLRQDFKVHALEKKWELTIGNFSLYLRIDRIDQVGASQYLIIDYKTSKRKQDFLFEERLLRPQLALYALNKNSSAGVVFAHIHPDLLGFCGVIENIDEEKLPAINSKALVKISISQQRQIWEKQIKDLLLEFQQGMANVEPHQKTQPCLNCNLSLLCRVKQIKKIEFPANPESLL